jgi:hypothetical protein
VTGALLALGGVAAPVDDAGSGVDAGLVGFLVFVGLFVAAGLLMRSMLTHARRVPPSFDPPPDDRDEQAFPTGDSPREDPTDPPAR